MTSFLIFIKHYFPWVWKTVEWINGLLFNFFYRGIEQKAFEVLRECAVPDFEFSVMESEDLPGLSVFLCSQPREHLAYFNPHGFDLTTLKRLFANRAFLMMKITRCSDQRMMGYFFLRCFFIGKAFHGLIVDRLAESKNLGTSMWVLSMQICSKMGLRMFATVSTHNIASLRSVRKGTEVDIRKLLANDYLLIECRPKSGPEAIINRVNG